LRLSNSDPVSETFGETCMLVASVDEQDMWQLVLLTVDRGPL